VIQVVYRCAGAGEPVFKNCSECGEGFAVCVGADLIPWMVGPWCAFCVAGLLSDNVSDNAPDTAVG
jgi:hypothetical protein